MDHVNTTLAVAASIPLGFSCTYNSRGGVGEGPACPQLTQAKYPRPPFGFAIHSKPHALLAVGARTK